MASLPVELHLPAPLLPKASSVVLLALDIVCASVLPWRARVDTDNARTPDGSPFVPCAVVDDLRRRCSDRRTGGLRLLPLRWLTGRSRPLLRPGGLEHRCPASDVLEPPSSRCLSAVQHHPRRPPCPPKFSRRPELGEIHQSSRSSPYASEPAARPAPPPRASASLHRPPRPPNWDAWTARRKERRRQAKMCWGPHRTVMRASGYRQV
jgi:hypothetical protein